MSFNESQHLPPSTSRLCDVCSKIPFNAEDPPFGDHAGGEKWPLGTLDRIRRRRDCPLCRLVVLAVYEIQRGGLSLPDGEVLIDWWAFIGPGGAFRLRGPGFYGYGTALNFVNESNGAQPSSSLPRAHSFIPIAQSRLDVSRARSWISACEDNHGDSCNLKWNHSGAFIPGIEALRLVDVANECLVELRGPCRYLTLSYVWGGVNNVRLTSSNKTSLMKNGVLQTIWDMLPRTVQDAIEFVKALGERFLWVDALCLIQNDTVDMRSGIEVMDLIYEKAALCLIAAYGDSANAGLPGVSGGTRLVTNHVEQIQPGITLAVYNDLDHLLRPSTYNRRAWTFQEQYLSPRALYFTADQVYFRCRESTWSENSVDWLPKPNNGRYVATMLPDAWKDSPEAEYRTILLYYTPRALTNQADALFAMAGITRRLSNKMRCRFFQGAPAAAFDMFMIFSNPSSIFRRRQGFPSYSWCGWIGQIHFYETNQENNWLAHRTWIIWYKRSSSGSVNLVWDIMANETFPIANMKFLGYRQRTPFGTRHSLGFSTSRTTPTQEHDFEREFPSYPILQFWTLAVYFTISDLAVFQASGNIRDKFGNSCGYIEMDGFEETTFFETSALLEFIVLSEREEGEPMTSWDRDNLYDSANRSNWKYYNVLLLEWNGGIAERRGLGVICQKAVERSFTPGPIWKEIFLA